MKNGKCSLHIHTIFQVFQIMKEVIIFHNLYYFLVKNFLNPQSRPEGSYKIESVRPSVRPSFRLSVRFLRIGLLVFTETQHGVRGPYLVMCNSRIFLAKSLSGKNDRKWSKMTQKHGFGAFQENHVISFVWNLCKMKFLMVH